MGNTKFLVTIPEAAELLSLSRAFVYKLIARGEIPVIHIGRAARIPVAELERWVARQVELEEKRS